MEAAVKSEKLKALFRSGRQLKYQKNELIIRANDTPAGVYLIESGIVKIYALTKQGNQHVTHFFGPGDFFPIIWTFRGHIRNVYYEAIEPVSVRVVSRDVFMDLVTRNKDVLFELLEEMVERYLRYAGRIENLLYSDARERCAYRLLSLGNRFGVQTKDGLLIDVTITHEDMARSLNMTRETFGRSLNRLQERGVIGYNVKRRIVIKDLAALVKIIGREEAETTWPELMQQLG